jgi:nicotinamidase-related amidase
MDFDGPAPFPLAPTRPRKASPVTRFAPNAALLLIDVQNGFDDPIWGRRNNPHMEECVASLLRAWRESRRPIFHAKHLSCDSTSPLRPHQSGNDFKAIATPLPHERVVEKRVNSCFIGTSLGEELRNGGHDTLIVAGLTTNHCVSSTVRMASNLGFRVVLVSDATATFDRVGPDEVRYSAEQIQAVTLADLHDEFAAVVATDDVLAAIQKGTLSPARPE